MLERHAQLAHDLERPILVEGALWYAAVVLAVVLVGLGVMVWADPLYSLTERAAEDLLDPSRYVEAVLGGAP